MEELRGRIVVGNVTTTQEQFVIIPGSVTAEDLATLRRAAAGSGEVLIPTEYGPWPFRIDRVDPQTGSFHLVSLPPGAV